MNTRKAAELGLLFSFHNSRLPRRSPALSPRSLANNLDMPRALGQGEVDLLPPMTGPTPGALPPLPSPAMAMSTATGASPCTPPFLCPVISNYRKRDAKRAALLCGLSFIKSTVIGIGIILVR